jgi:uncharacterized protein YegJ (DUF2314 family)
MKFWSLFVLLLVAVGCSKPAEPTIPPGEEGNVKQVSAEDPEMQKAIATAQRTFPDFKLKLAKATPDDFCSVKVRLEGTDGTYEHIWLEDVKAEGGRIKGVLANDPVHLSQKIGDPVDVPESQLSDWAVFDKDGKVVAGGYSINLLKGE